MARLVVYGSSVPCPDMARFQWWLQRFQVPGMVMLDIHHDEEAYDKVVAWTGHASVPTLVIAPDDGFDPIEPPEPITAGKRVRAFDRGTVLTEPNPGQIADFIQRHGIPVQEVGKEPPAPIATKSADPQPAGETHPSEEQQTSTAPTVITVYPITGRQLFFTVPHSWCVECNLTIRAVQQVIEGDDRFELRIRPWWNNLFSALWRGGWHAPVVTINGKLFTQGIVPDAAELRRALGITTLEAGADTR